MIVERVQTKVLMDDLIRAVRAAWTTLFGETPSTETCAILFAQYAFETAWGACCWNYNIGNHRAGKGYQGAVFELPGADEYVNGKRVIVGGNFRAYACCLDGVQQHLILISSMVQYAKAFEVLKNGEGDVVERAHAFAHGLKDGGYFTGDEVAYAHGIASIANDVVAHSISFPITGLPDLKPWYSNFDIFSHAFFDDYSEPMAKILCDRFDCEHNS